jgi:multiple sugar transport system substrate-binding protein
MRQTHHTLTWIGRLAAALLALVVAGSVFAQPVTLRLFYPGWDSTEQEIAVTGLIAEFEAANPDVRIEIISTPFGVFQERLFVSLRSGDAPDVGYIGARWLQELRENGFLNDMSGVMANLPREDWIEGTFFGVETPEGLFAIADRVDPWVIYTNERLLAEAGVTTCPATTDEFIEAGQSLTGGGVAAFGLVGAKHATQIMQFANWLYAHHGHFVSEDGTASVFDSPNAVAALQFYVDLFKEHEITQLSAVSDSRDQVRQLFFTEQLAMFVDGPWAMGTIDETAPNVDWGVCPIPQVPGLERNSVLSAWYYTIFSNTPYPEQAGRFVEFMLRPENMARGVVTLPARYTAQANERFQTERWAPFIEAAQYGSPELSSRAYSDIADVVGDAIQEVLLGVKTAERAAADASTAIDLFLR